MSSNVPPGGPRKRTQEHDALPVSFTVVGKAQPGGSKRSFRHPHTGKDMVVDANRKAKPWQSIVASVAAEAMHGRRLFTGALLVRFAFYQPRPRGHFGIGRNSHLLRGSAPRYPIVRPDVLKLARAVEDALTGVCWRDDALIVSEHLSKHYGEPARCEIQITPLDGPAAGIAP